MLWALMAKFLTRQPPLVQAVVVGLCTGLFVTTGAQANNRNPLIQTVLLQIIVVGVIAGSLFYFGLVKGPQDADHEDAPLWAYIVYAVVWLGALAAALLALFGNGGFKVAALAIVPLVLLAPPAFQAFRLLAQRGRE